MGVGLFIKRKDVNDNILFWFKPADANEKYIAIMGAIDCWVIRGIKLIVRIKNYFWIT
jgi:hypothetical protein